MERIKDFSKLSIDLKQNENCATMATKIATHGSGSWGVIDLKWRYMQHVNSQHVVTYYSCEVKRELVTCPDAKLLKL